MAILGIATLACLTAALGLFVEYLIRSWVETRNNGTKPYQFTLAEMLVATAALALLLGFFRIFGVAMIAVLVLIIIVSGFALEMARRSRMNSRDRDSFCDQPDSRSGMANNAQPPSGTPPGGAGPGVLEE
jgi:hypothetical protein